MPCQPLAPYAAARKTGGRPKLDKLLKSPLEGKSKRKRGDVNKGKVGGKRRSQINECLFW